MPPPPAINLTPSDSSVSAPESSSTTTSISLLPNDQKQKKLEEPTAEKKKEDEFNDVAAMAGINVAEEEDKMMDSVDLSHSETRLYGNVDSFLFGAPLASKIRSISQKYGLQDVGPEVLLLISQATQERLKQLVEKLSVVAEHRMESLRVNPLFEQTTDIRAQMRFLEGLSKNEITKQENREKESVLKLLKSKSSRPGDLERQRMKEKNKEMQKAEQEEMQKRNTNATAHMALASQRKRSATAVTGFLGIRSPSGQLLAFPSHLLRPRFKRVNVRDLQVVLSRERESKQSKTFQRLFYK